MSIRAGLAPVALALHKEAAHVGSVAIVVQLFAADALLDLLKLLYGLWIVIWQVKLLDLRVHVVRPVISVGQLFRHFDLFFLGYVLVSELDRQTEIEVENAGLAYVLELGAGLAYFSLLVPRIRSRLPSENRKRPRAHLALPRELRLGHPDIRILAQTGLAQNRKVRLLPPLLLGPRSNA